MAALCSEAAGTECLGKPLLEGRGKVSTGFAGCPWQPVWTRGVLSIKRECQEKRAQAAALILTELLGKLCVFRASAQINPKWESWSYVLCNT